MQIECPKCDKKIDMTDHMPDTASDEVEVECECGCVMEVGWYATAEVRSVISNATHQARAGSPSPAAAGSAGDGK